MEIIQSPLMGVTFRPKGTKDSVRALNIGEHLLLEAEPENPYDSNAVKVLTEDGEFIGYLARESNMETAEHLANGGEVRVTILSFLSDIKPHLQIELLDEESVED